MFKRTFKDDTHFDFLESLEARKVIKTSLPNISRIYNRNKYTQFIRTYLKVTLIFDFLESLEALSYQDFATYYCESI